MIKREAVKNEKHGERLSKKAILTIGVHAFIGWALCTAAMVIPMITINVETALVIHAVGAPVIFTTVSLNYFKKFNYTSPGRTGLIFVGFVIFMDFFLVAMIVMRSFEMFASLLGTWIPFTLIFISTFVTGLLVNRRSME
jgi:hypothetical protein